jgi:hypothetical protein
MNKLYAGTIELILLDLDLALKHRETPEAVEVYVTRAKTWLLRAALADVDVEPMEQERAA